jgi:H+/gluconate symporter-like permease
VRALLSYSFLRIAIFFVVLLVLALAGVHGFLLLLVAAAASALVSLVTLSRLRNTMSASITRRMTNFRERLDEGTKAEDTD